MANLKEGHLRLKVPVFALWNRYPGYEAKKALTRATIATADVGYRDFRPPRLGQDEEVLSDKHIKDDFLLLLPVPDEHQSAAVIFLQQDAKGGRTFDQSVLADLEHHE
ncbi:hypothetical protein EV424DRAFT_1558458 [Suillus variegatus]|nr:hypothetical protein EV424DRAFT_1558458 [Suillus variegatus]